MDKKKFIKENWSKKLISEMTSTLDISIRDFLEIAFELELHKKDTQNNGRRWTIDEAEFLLGHANELSVREASNLLYRSYYATYQKIRVLGLGDKMINKK